MTTKILTDFQICISVPLRFSTEFWLVDWSQICGTRTILNVIDTHTHTHTHTHIYYIYIDICILIYVIYIAKVRFNCQDALWNTCQNTSFPIPIFLCKDRIEDSICIWKKYRPYKTRIPAYYTHWITDMERYCKHFALITYCLFYIYLLQ